jgi:hypothetical protein
MRLPWLYYIFVLVHIITAFVGGFRYKSLPRPLRPLVWLISISVVDSLGKWVLISYNIRTLWLSHYFTLLELILISLMYAAWTKQDNRKKTLYWCIGAFFLFWIVGKFSFEPFSYPDDLTATISKVLQILFSLFILIDVNRESNIEWSNDPRMWIAAGIILYAAGTLLWYAFFEKMLQESPERLRQSYFLNWILLISSNLFYIRGFLCRK